MTIQPFNPNSVDPKEVNSIHRRSDVNSSSTAQHHTLGANRNQASPGDHDHKGENSVPLLSGIVLTGAKGGNVALANLITALTAFGLEDSTT